MLKYKNLLTENLIDNFNKSKLSFNYASSNDKVMDDEVIMWAGKKNGLKVIVCDKYIHNRDFFKVVKTGFKGNEPFEFVVYNGTSVVGVTSTVKRVLDSFKAKREFYLKSKKK